jgi:hypothetical protein
MRIHYLLFLGSLSLNIAIAMENNQLAGDDNTLASYISPQLASTQLFQKINALEKTPETITKNQQLHPLYTEFLGSITISKKYRKEITKKRKGAINAVYTLLNKADNLITDYTTACEQLDSSKALFYAKQLKDLYAPESAEYKSWHETQLDYEKPSLTDQSNSKELSEPIISTVQIVSIEPIQEKNIESSSVQTVNDQIAPIVKAIEQTKLIISAEEQKQPLLTQEEQLAKIREKNRYNQRAKSLLEITEITKTNYATEKEAILALIRAFGPLIIVCDGAEKKGYENQLASLQRRYNLLNKKNN